MVRHTSPLVVASIALNVALLVAALSMGIPMVARIQEQLALGYVPGFFGTPEFAVLIASPFVVAGLIGLGLALWSSGRPWWLVLADAIAVAAAWTAFVPFVFVNGAPLVAMPLSITALIVTLVAVFRHRERRVQSEVTHTSQATTRMEDG